MKKLIALALTLLLLAVPVLSLADGSMRQKPLLVDEGDLLTVEEEATLLAELERISAEQKCDVVVVIPRSLGGKSATAYADDYYDANGFGYGTTKDGILLMVCMEERDYATCTTGAAQDWFDDGTLYDIENAFVPLLSAGKYFEAFSTYASRCERVLQGVDRREVLYLDDAAGLLSESERAAVTRRLESNSHVAANCDIVVLTVPSLGQQSAEDYAASIFHSGTYRHGAGYDKVALVIDRAAGMCYCVTDGSANTYFPEKTREKLAQNAASAISSGDIPGAFSEFAESAYRTIDSYYHTRHIQYFSPLRLAGALAVGLIVGLIVASVLKGQLKSVKSQVSATEYLVRDSLNMVDSKDLFLYASVSKTVRQSETRSGGGSGHSGGGSHFSSSGFSHGGHSGKF